MALIASRRSCSLPCFDCFLRLALIRSGGFIHCYALYVFAWLGKGYFSKLCRVLSGRVLVNPLFWPCCRLVGGWRSLLLLQICLQGGVSLPGKWRVGGLRCPATAQMSDPVQCALTQLCVRGVHARKGEGYL